MEGSAESRPGKPAFRHIQGLNQLHMNRGGADREAKALNTTKNRVSSKCERGQSGSEKDHQGRCCGGCGNREVITRDDL